MKRFAVGLGKKLLIANAMGAVADRIFGLAPGDINAGIAWIGAVAYSLQIYFDFSGYSDMAIGLAGLFGFKLKENFDYPYTARSIKIFWRKWHISLSTWFKEYLYIPLGGNRKGTLRTAVNLIIVFFCTGLWHGAQWTFIIWGFFHGLFLILERVGVIRAERWPKGLGVAYTLLVAVTAFTIFRADTLPQGFAFISAMFTGFWTSPVTQGIVSETLSASVIVFGAAAIVGATPLAKNLLMRAKEHANALVYEAVTMTGALALLALCMLTLASQTYNPFIYFRF